MGRLCKLDEVILRVEVKVEVAGNDSCLGRNVLKEAEHRLVVLLVGLVVKDCGQVI